MTQGWAEMIVFLAIAYLAVGLVFGILFLSRGITRVDVSADGAGWSFRLLVLPGITALWPLLLRRWLRASGGPPEEITAHRRAAR